MSIESGAPQLESDQRRAIVARKPSDSRPSLSANVGLALPSSAPRGSVERWRRLLVSFAVLLGLGVLVTAFGDAVRDLDYAQMVHVLRRLPERALAASLAATALSFSALVARDASALRFVGARASFTALVIGGFAGSAVGNALGFGILTAAAVRYRIYGAVGVKPFDVARLIMFVVAGFVVGLASVGGVSAIWEADAVGALLGLPPILIRAAGGLGLAAVGAILAFGAPKSARWGNFFAVAPSRSEIAFQILLTSVRMIGAALAFWTLLPSAPIHFLTFAAIFSAASALAALAHVPAGVGVFEIMAFWAFRGLVSNEAIAAALIAFRAIYYLLPLALSAAAFAYFEVTVALRAAPPGGDERLARAAARLSPTFMGALAFACGTMLMASGATPIFGRRLAALSLHVPLWAVEAASFLGSLIGVLFLFVARGLMDRRDGAWKIALALGVSSVMLSLVKGLAFGEATILLFFTVLLLATRRQFHRPTSMFDQPFTRGWFAAVAGIVAASFGLLWLAFHDTPSGLDSVWRLFAFDAQAPRALRAVIGAAILAAGFMVAALLRPPKGLAPRPDADALARAFEVIDAQKRGDAMLALMGEKSFIFSDSGRSLMMFGKRGRSWIALFDPIGPREEWPELIGKFIRTSKHHGGRAAFYQVRPDSLPYYLDAGFSVMKLGEDAIVDLTAFSLKGGAAAHLRYALKRGERDGLQFQLLAPHEIAPHFDALAEISAQWLESGRRDEKGFSVAAFEPSFLGVQHVGLLTQGGRPVAFVSAMATRAGGEATVGLMRNAGVESPVAMEYLFVRLIESMRAMGFERLSLGGAPLAGLRPTPLSSRWHRLGALIWKHGDRFYNFQGLRTFKSKFNPIWEPRYFAASGAVGPFVALADVAALVGAGLPSWEERRP